MWTEHYQCQPCAMNLIIRAHSHLPFSMELANSADFEAK